MPLKVYFHKSKSISLFLISQFQWQKVHLYIKIKQVETYNGYTDLMLVTILICNNNE